MQTLYPLLENHIADFLSQQFPNISIPKILLQQTNKDHSGDVTLMVFPIAKKNNLNPDTLAASIGEFLVTTDLVASYDVVKGFLNLHFSYQAWKIILQDIASPNYQTAEPRVIAIEYAGPNTNKPLHIGHLRNIFIGNAVANILQKVNHRVHRVNIYNDRGIAICKSMIAYQLFGNGATPDSAGLKGDFFVGHYYVQFNTEYSRQVNEHIAQGIDKKTAESSAPIMIQAQEMLLMWEDNEPQIVALWNQMNQWFYEGVQETFRRLGITFEKEYYESNEYKKGKEIVDIGLKKGTFYQDNSGAIMIDLSHEGMDQKILQRADGTSIYITQDLALIRQRYEDFHMNQMIYVVGDEQEYHFRVLRGIMDALHEPYSSSIYHLSYGMVTSTDGSKFKSREGTAADADAIIDDVIAEAKAQTIHSGKSEQFSAEELDSMSEAIGLGALRYAMLRVNPKKSIPFDPKEAVDLHGDTGTFIQYSYVRTRSILNRVDTPTMPAQITEMADEEKQLLLHLATFSNALNRAATNYDPSEIAQFALQLTKLFNRFYTQHPILSADNEYLRQSRIYYTYLTSSYISQALSLLGISSPERM